MFEKAIDDADDPDVFTEAGNPRSQAADTPDVEKNLHAGLRRSAEGLDDFGIGEGIHLGPDQALLPLPLPFGLVFDELDKPRLEADRRGFDLVHRNGLGKPGDHIEEGGGVPGILLPAGHVSDIAVEGGRLLVVVARPEMNVAPDSGRFAADDDADLGVGLEAADPVDDLGPGLFEFDRPDDVSGLVEAGLEFDQNGDVLFLFRGSDEGGHDGTVFACPVENLLDGQDVGIVRGFLDEPLDGIETFVGMREKDILPPDDVEDGAALFEVRDRLGNPGFDFQIFESGHAGRPHVGREIERSRNGVHPFRGHVKEGPQNVQSRACGPGGDFQPDNGAQLSFDEDLFHFLEKIGGLILADGQVGIPGDPKGHAFRDDFSGE